MKTYHILYEMLGENATSAPDPRRVYDPNVGVDFAETKICCRSSDDDSLERVRRWTVGLALLPDWLPPMEWIRNRVNWKWTWVPAHTRTGPGIGSAGS